MLQTDAQARLFLRSPGCLRNPRQDMSCHCIFFHPLRDVCVENILSWTVQSPVRSRSLCLSITAIGSAKICFGKPPVTPRECCKYMEPINKLYPTPVIPTATSSRPTSLDWATRKLSLLARQLERAAYPYEVWLVLKWACPKMHLQTCCASSYPSPA